MTAIPRSGGRGKDQPHLGRPRETLTPGKVGDNYKSIGVKLDVQSYRHLMRHVI